MVVTLYNKSEQLPVSFRFLLALFYSELCNSPFYILSGESSARRSLQHPAIALQLALVGQNEMPRLDFAKIRRALRVVVNTRVINQQLFLMLDMGIRQRDG